MTDLYKDFSGRDFTARYEALLTRLRSEVPELTDLNHADPGISLLRLLSREVDQLGFYLDEAFGEGFIGTARFMQSLIDIAATTDYPPKLASAATTTLRLTRMEGVTGDIVVPQYSRFRRSDGIEYVTEDPVTIPDGEDAVDARAIQGILTTLVLAPENWNIGPITRRPQYNLGQHVVTGSVSMIDEFGLVWTEVDSFWRSRSTDRHFLLQLYADKHNNMTNTVFLVLGDGTQGEGLPSASVTVSYLVTAGPSGNSGIGTITEPPGDLVDYITCSNIVVANGGAFAEGREAYRSRIPQVTRTQRRAVTTEDYEALIGSIPGVLHVQALDRNTASKDLTTALWGSGDYGWPHEYTVLVVVPDGGGPMSTQLRETILRQCASWGHHGPWRERYILMDAIERPVNVSVKIGVGAGYSSDAVRTAVNTAIADELSVENQEIGGEVSFAGLYARVVGVNGVSWANFSTPTSDIISPEGFITVPGTITVTVA